MFVLTKEEKRVICFVMLAILVGLGVKEYRRGHTANSSGAPARLKAIARETSRSEAASERYCGASSEYLINRIEDKSMLGAATRAVDTRSYQPSPHQSSSPRR